MKKLFFIFVLFLVWSGSAYAKIIIFKKCAFERDSDFDYGRFETFEYRFDTTKMNGLSIRLHTDKFIKENPGEKKIYTEPYKIIHADSDYIIAHTSTQKLEAVLKTKTVTWSFLEQAKLNARNWSTNHRCE